MGEASHVVFAPLKSRPKPAPPVEVVARLADPTQQVVYGKPFTVVLTVHNKSELVMNLTLRVPMTTFAPVAPLNVMQEQLGSRKVRGTIELRVELVPLACGLHHVDGIVVMDSKRNKFSARPLAVFVEAE
jgi:hypothetical protein